MKKKRYVFKSLACIFLISMLMIAGCSSEGEDADTSKPEQSEEVKREPDKESGEEKEEISDHQEETSGEDKAEEVKSRDVKVYYVDDQTGEVAEKTVQIQSEYDIWSVLQETGILTEDCRLLSFKADENTRKIELDFNAAVGNRIRSMGTTGETQIIGCIVNTYLDAYACDGIKLTEEGKKLETSHGADFDGYSGKITF